ncbi:hypothetical protein H5410_052909 [Solanum commersonii]|uniref:ATP binding protein n=1 Tax=Solanum commersonii TaxID=4109 RepID=A0A9J5X2V0_SOLCO|nr:hypothetical protein H5410_052909 [Solanum commersonii]
MSSFHFIACHVLILTLATVQTSTTNSTSITITKPGCPKQCGNVTVPYPFGIGSGCAFDSGFEVDCNISKKPLIGNNLTVYDISDAELRISNDFGWRCYGSNGAVIGEHMVYNTFLESSPYSFSALNRFMVVGCDDYGSMTGPDDFWYSCNASCVSSGDMTEGVCMGKGCCQKQIPKGLKYYTTTMSSTGNHTDVWSFNSCGYAFLGEADSFRFLGLPDLGDDLSVDYFFERLKATVPIVLDWAIGNLTCTQARKTEDYACTENSYCIDSDTGLGGYRCSCNTGYQGNPYLNQGCKDIDECADHPNNSLCEKICLNTPGSYNCSCPHGYTGDGKKDGHGCIAPYPNQFPWIKFSAGIGAVGFISLVVVTIWLCFRIRKRKLIEVREKFFQQNGGLLLKHRISTNDGGLKATKIFTAEELKKATDNYAHHKILGRGGNAIVYRGVLSDNRIVAIKKSRIVDESQIEQFTVVGCDDYASITGPNNFEYGCNVSCTSRGDVIEGECMGKGCCQKQIPKGLKYYNTTMSSTQNHTDVWSFNSCGYAFLGEADCFRFQGLPDLGDDLNVDYFYERIKASVPIVLDWAIGNIDECADHPNNNLCEKICLNTPGSYHCSCPHGYYGDGKKDGRGCIAPYNYEFPWFKFSAGIGAGGFISLVVGIVWFCFRIRKWKLIEVREKFFQQNGGLLLKHRISTNDSGFKATKVFTEEELKKATNNYANDRILGRGGHAIVYRGVLSENRIVAIKKSRIVDESQIEQFINEVLILTQINHRNVVRLFGCCLEDEVPLLVYEYVSEGTLYEHIHNQRGAAWLNWQNRLRISIETATALAYLHSFASMPIIHRDVKSANILLDNVYTAKVADFGASRLIPLDQTHVATSILGTSGYLDPEYFRTSQLTEKSDVYSFGKPIIRSRNDEQNNLADYFVWSVDNNCLFQILDRRVLREGNLEQLQQMAELVKNCLQLHGEDRPTMKEVTIELEGLRKVTGVSWSNQHGVGENDQDELSDLYTVPINSNGNPPNSDSARIMHGRYSPS